MTDEQRAILEQQVQRIRSARQVVAQEEHTLRQMLILHDPRFADPESGVEFDLGTLAISGRQS